MTLSDAKILGAGRGGLQVEGRDYAKTRGYEGSWHVEGMAGSLVWLEHQVHGTLIL